MLYCGIFDSFNFKRNGKIAFCYLNYILILSNLSMRFYGDTSKHVQYFSDDVIKILHRNQK